MKLIVLFVLCFVLPGCVTYYNPATQRKEAAWISVEQEMSIAEKTLQAKLKDKTIVKDERASRAATRIARSIDGARIPRKAIVVYEDKDVQAFTPGGGYVVITTGLLAAASDDELAAVIAHEMGHDEARHVMKAVEAGIGTQAVLTLAYLLDPRQANDKDRSWQYLSQAAGIIYTLASKGYSRRDEYEADRLSIKYMSQAGYNPGAIVTFLAKLKQVGGDASWIYFLRSHPYLDERISAAREELKKYDIKKGDAEVPRVF
jgi:beta-barrel assembly-enhancing protease